ncbi:VanZ family protein [Sinomonas sp. R1AF57]|uniref:VanZ family protein n=1 Tax=Sinomonas sp. R1AF57 TaxID=2020377 RepID=UPI000B5E6317|nr:VanZ family protein [Sinomonas sp. R1AF57]ASN51489.1 hypothetical protein CGQ25_04880 [Sinomonas sp. R1AF57]
MRRGTALWGLGIYGALLAVLVFSPVGPSLRGVHLPAGVSAGAVEAAANVAVFMPLGFFVASLLPLGRRWLAVGACSALSVGIETVQFAFLSSRSGNVRDAITNTAGAVLGVLLCSIWLRVLEHRIAARAVARPQLSNSSTRS